MRTLHLAAALVFGSSQLIGCGLMEDNKKPSASLSSDGLNNLISGWPISSQEAAISMFEKYGRPTESTPSVLIWRKIGPFKRIIVYREEVIHKFPLLHKDVIEHVIDFQVPLDRVEELTRFDGSLYFDRTRGELSARGNNENMNLLALNLANDIISGRRHSQEARIEFGRLAIEHMNGKSTPYTQALQFGRQLNTADPDENSKINWTSTPAQAQEARPQFTDKKARILKEAEQELAE